MPSPSKLPITKLPPTVWNKIEAEVAIRASRGQDVIALHVGDAYLPFPATLLTPIEGEDRLFPRLNRYSDTFGELPLREAIVDKVRRINKIPIEDIDSIQVTAGATGALYAAFSRLLESGSEVLTPAPYWSILRQVADAAKVQLVEVPFFDVIAREGLGDPTVILQKYVTPRTSAIYLNNPSNPTGMLLNRDWLCNIVEFALKHDIWIISDEAYEDYIWNGQEQSSIASLPDAYERTVSVFTFSKCFGASGMRTGYAVAPPHVTSQINRGIVGTCYQAGRIGQRNAWRGLQNFNKTVALFRDDYRKTYEWVRNNIHAEMLPCVGGFYFFIQLGSGWIDLTSEKKIDHMLDAGVVLAPGEFFGVDYNGWARLCFTVVSPEKVKIAVERLNNMINNKK